jgi:hypothetical protein
MSKSVIKGFAGRFFDAGWRIKIRFTDFQMDNTGACAFQLLGPFQHIHYDKGGQIPRAT